MSSTLPISTWSAATPDQLLTEVLVPLIGLLVRGGISREQLSEAIALALEQADFPDGPSEPIRLGAIQRDCMEVMCKWRRDTRFLGIDGLPRALSVSAEGANFSNLCEVAGVKADPTKVLNTLLEFGAVEVEPSTNAVLPLTPTFLLGGGGRSVALDGVLKQLAAFVRVLEHNTRSGEGGGTKRFERMCTVVLASELMPVFERTLRERGQEFIDRLDEWLERHRNAESASGSYTEVGAGAYFVELGRIKNM